jgi:TPP-dependent pyruvate/acetoin dehydrogenase alpha subunit
MTTTGAGLRELAEMQRIRSFEERVRELCLEKQIIGSVHLSIGQESIAVATCAALEPQDAVFATYRGHGWALARGVPMTAMFAELLGRSTGLNGGRGGSAYFSAPAQGFFGENSIVGGGAPLATGAALAGRFDGSNRVAVVAFGDGATNQGAVHEAMNFAAAFSLPVIFVCENNTYSELTPISDMVGEPELWRRAAGYGMPGSRIDGHNLSVVTATMTEAVQRARNGQGPTFVEAMTERLVGHYIGDIEHYRPAGEVDSAWEREPISRLRGELEAAGVDPQACQDTIDRAIAECTEAAASALSAPMATTEDIKEHLYA